jgi:hypothetical protein
VVPDPKDGAKEIKTSIDFDSARVGKKITLVGDLTKDKAGRMMIVTSVKRSGSPGKYTRTLELCRGVCVTWRDWQ